MNKIKFIIMFILLTTTICLAEQVVLGTGQSNNAGIGTWGVWSENSNVQIWNNTSKEFENLKEGFGLNWGFEMSLGNEISDIYIIKDIRPNGSLFEEFRPRVGSYYNAFFGENGIVQTALAELSDPEIVALLFTQGERDSRFDEWTAAYKQLQYQFIKYAREDLNEPCLPVIMAGVGASNTTIYKNRDEINEIKEYIADRLNIVSTFSTTDLSQSDGVHYNNAGLTELGIRYAESIEDFLDEIYPEEFCNNLDDDCDGSTDEGLTCTCPPPCSFFEYCGESPAIDDDCNDLTDEGGSYCQDRCEADMDSDEDVDGDDVDLLAEDYGRLPFLNPCTSGDPCEGDLDCNTGVDGDDIDILQDDYGRLPLVDPCPIEPGIEADWIMCFPCL